MKHRLNDSGFTGLEAAIVLIAFVVVAAVFSYVILGAGFFTTQKAQETIYKGVEQSTSNLQLVGQVYGMKQSTDVGITTINFTMGLSPGAAPMDLSKMTVVYSNGTGKTTFTKDTIGLSKDTISPGEQIEVGFVIPAEMTSTKISVEIRPGVGASLPFTRTIPATINNVNILY